MKNVEQSEARTLLLEQMHEITAKMHEMDPTDEGYLKLATALEKLSTEYSKLVDAEAKEAQAEASQKLHWRDFFGLIGSLGGSTISGILMNRAVLGQAKIGAQMDEEHKILTNPFVKGNIKKP